MAGNTHWETDIPKEALEKFGADLFLKENDKKDLGKEKISRKSSRSSGGC